MMKLMMEMLSYPFLARVFVGGFLFSAGALREYSYNANYEYIDLVIAAFLGVYLALRHGIAKFIKVQKKTGGI